MKRTAPRKFKPVPCFTKSEARRDRMRKLAKELINRKPGLPENEFGRLYNLEVLALKLARMVLRG